MDATFTNVKVGDYVIIAEDNIERSKWSLAISQNDQVVGSAEVKTAINELVPPAAKLCLLEEGS